jgi:hypothetical protein
MRSPIGIRPTRGPFRHLLSALHPSGTRRRSLRQRRSGRGGLRRHDGAAWTAASDGRDDGKDGSRQGEAQRAKQDPPVSPELGIAKLTQNNAI